MGEDFDYWGAPNKCQSYSFFNKVPCDLVEGHSGAHIHRYDAYHLCGWENDSTK